MKEKRVFACCLFLVLIFPLTLLGDDFVIKGFIKDSQTGQPLSNANINIEGTSIGTSSDIDGQFNLNITYPGNYVLRINYIGYKTFRKSVHLTFDKTIDIEVQLIPVVLEGKSVMVTAKADVNKARERVTPVAFTKLDIAELKNNYTTGNLPDLIQDVPGVWTSSAGLGESEIIVRGFTSDKVRFMVNDIPMNEPEDNQVYWSNWASLANTAKSIEVHRGPGFSLYGPAAFGGSVHIETMGVGLIPGSSLRFSSGVYRRIGIIKGRNVGAIADPDSPDHIIDVENAVNYTYSLRMNSGPLYNGKLNVSGFLEYKTGDSYLYGTDYNGYSIGLEAEGLIRRHFFRMSFFMSPQEHNQAFALQDIELLKEIGREYNRKNHSYQENYYVKPFLSLKHEWNISDNQRIVNNLFVTMGKGADQTLINDVFDVTNGHVDFQPVDFHKTIVAFGSHAGYLYKYFGLMCADFIHGGDIGVQWFKKEDAGKKKINLFADNRDHSWQRRNRRDHNQVGLSSLYQHQFNEQLQGIVGIDGQVWRGHREAEVWYLRFSPGIRYRGTDVYYIVGDNVQTDQLQSIYNYDTEVDKFSGFVRIHYSLFRNLNLQAGGQVSTTKMKVIENPIRFIDIGDFIFFEDSYRTSADQINDDGDKRFAESDYKRRYSYLSEWIGLNYNLSGNFNAFTNYATSQKEPAILDWYDFDKGPLLAVVNGEKLKPEEAQSFESGLGFDSPFLKTKINYYYTRYENKIETVVDINDRRRTTNAGSAVFQGIEWEFRGEYREFNFLGTATLAQNHWQKMAVDSIFGAAAKDVQGKVVPFSPQRIFSAEFGYRIEPYATQIYHLTLRLNYWDEYYGNYTNYYITPFGEYKSAKLPFFLDFSAQLSFTKRMKKVDLSLRLDANNILNRVDNYLRAQYTIDYTRNDKLAGKYNWYVLQAPLLNVFLTAEVAIH